MDDLTTFYNSIPDIVDMKKMFSFRLGFIAGK